MSKVVRAIARTALAALILVVLQPTAQAHELAEGSARSHDKTAETAALRRNAKMGHWSLDGLRSLVQAVRELSNIQALIESGSKDELLRSQPGRRAP